MISRKPKLRRQKKLFKQKGKVLRPDQMNINVAAWGRLIKNKNLQSSVGVSANSAEPPHAIVQSLSDEGTSSTMGHLAPNSVLSSDPESDKAFPLTPISSQASITTGRLICHRNWSNSINGRPFMHVFLDKQKPL